MSQPSKLNPETAQGIRSLPAGRFDESSFLITIGAIGVITCVISMVLATLG